VEATRNSEQELHERVLARLRGMTRDEAFALAVEAGIYTPDGELTPPYREDAGPSLYRPTD
jgi:hypothetical protein